MFRIQRVHCYNRLALVALGLVVFICELALPTSAADPHCDPGLEQSASDNTLGYQLRDDDRCEGRYIRSGSATLFPVSLTEFFEEYDLESQADLNVEWTAPSGQNVRLRAHGLRSRLYYRMDTARPSDTTSFRWPTRLLSGLDIPRRDLGVIGWMTTPIGKTTQDVFLPLRISQKGTATLSQSYRMILWPGKELTEVYISLATVETDGSIGSFIKDGEALEYGYYPASMGIDVDIDGMEAPGVYYLEIGADLRNGGVVVIKHWFYHAG
ncbi:MAG: hypothetical protein GY801_41685 [bacterium]|nr:hypothetical protein [bacterium]